ncbi:MAG: signal peptidase I [Planctomycetales bacterium 4572_13]|nr:MAG: signal peptidase I [Planctomycetales bacterium 4572_13]
MEEKRPQPQESLAHRHQHSVESIITLLEWLVVAFILALMFMTFAMQAFQIPTGSMAETLRGKHYRIRCIRCGHAFDVGNDAVSYGRPQCPNCDYIEPGYALGPVNNGDRIFVLKSIYQFFPPQRWDVVVFKNPANPLDNYIKRLIALPGETVELVNGDVFINGKVARKPASVQKELWMPIFLQDYQPLEAVEHFNELVLQGQDGNNKTWKSAFENEPNSLWQLDDMTVFTLNEKTGTPHTMVYASDNPNDFRASYGYNESAGYPFKPIVSDLMVSFYAKCDVPDGTVGASLEKYGVHYSAQVEFDGAMVFTKTVGGQTTQLRPPMLSGGIETGRFEKFEFANVDQLLVFRWGEKRFTYDLSKDAGFKPVNGHYEKPPTVRLFASGPTEIRHIGLYRDTFYMGEELISLRATKENPFTLNKDEFFVCGDNSNNSLDGRFWSTPGISNNEPPYRVGVVPRDYMMGKAVMVYWSQAFRPAGDLPSMIPNLDNLKVISGGSEREY